MRTKTVLTLVVVMAGLTVPVFDVWGEDRVVVGTGTASTRSSACEMARLKTVGSSRVFDHSSYVKIHDSGCSCVKDEDEEFDLLTSWHCEVHATYRKEKSSLETGDEILERSD